MSIEAAPPERERPRTAAQMQQAPRSRPRPVEPPQPDRVRVQRRSVEKLREAQSPWWFSAPKVLLACAKIAMLPLNVAIKLAELAMAAVVIGIAGALVGWYLGYITDTDVVNALKPIGDRLLQMVQASGML